MCHVIGPTDTPPGARRQNLVCAGDVPNTAVRSRRTFERRTSTVDSVRSNRLGIDQCSQWKSHLRRSVINSYRRAVAKIDSNSDLSRFSNCLASVPVLLSLDGMSSAVVSQYAGIARAR